MLGNVWIKSFVTDVDSDEQSPRMVHWPLRGLIEGAPHVIDYSLCIVLLYLTYTYMYKNFKLRFLLKKLEILSIWKESILIKIMTDKFKKPSTLLFLYLENVLK